MVWSLVRVDPQLGGGGGGGGGGVAQTYYIFSRGTYRVGRKDGDIVFDDQTVSRVHADVVVDRMEEGGGSKVRVVNISKLGTSIKKASGPDSCSGSSYRAVKLSPKCNSNEAELDEGDLLTFGNVTLRFLSVPVVVFVHSNADRSIQDSISSIGARTCFSWTPECTHVLVVESSPVTLDIVEAVLAKKHVVLVDWVKMLAVNKIRSELPSYIPYIPTLILEGISVRIVDPDSRGKCLEGFEFVLGSSDKYIFGDKFKSLLEVGGAKFINADEFSSNSQTSADGENNYVLVVPEKSPNELKLSRELSSLPRVTDFKLVAACLSGHMDSSFLEPPSVIVSSSCSTDGTIVADSDVEIDTAASEHVAADAKSHDAFKHEYEDREAQLAEDKEDVRRDQDSIKSRELPITSSDMSKISRPEEDVCSIKKMEKGDDSLADRHENSDIIYSPCLIAKNVNISLPDECTKTKHVNFKCFRKRETASGNSFKDLIPFSKDPYNESDCGSNGSEYTRGEEAKIRGNCRGFQ
ncbi:nijmegen breakage syndrome 1 protein isoform X1 [Iris pallida]|uniref:Nijmegen breakage syndrome 1 protein isoform X1 n=1 Tax=Iris pallida TaxID=29817 RepID=A0AAX6GH34_IRIPA|nr:nijmegen breakage syndrome 1 protein isoform X1 [Iris pallida]